MKEITICSAWLATEQCSFKYVHVVSCVFTLYSRVHTVFSWRYICWKLQDENKQNNSSRLWMYSWFTHFKQSYVLWPCRAPPLAKHSAVKRWPSLLKCQGRDFHIDFRKQQFQAVCIAYYNVKYNAYPISSYRHIDRLL